MYLSDELIMRSREGYSRVYLVQQRGKLTPNEHSSERINSSSREHIYYLISYTT